MAEVIPRDPLQAAVLALGVLEKQSDEVRDKVVEVAEVIQDEEMEMMLTRGTRQALVVEIQALLDGIPAPSEQCDDVAQLIKETERHLVDIDLVDDKRETEEEESARSEGVEEAEPAQEDRSEPLHDSVEHEEEVAKTPETLPEPKEEKPITSDATMNETDRVDQNSEEAEEAEVEASATPLVEEAIQVVREVLIVQESAIVTELAKPVEHEVASGGNGHIDDVLDDLVSCSTVASLQEAVKEDLLAAPEVESRMQEVVQEEVTHIARNEVTYVVHEMQATSQTVQRTESRRTVGVTPAKKRAVDIPAFSPQAEEVMRKHRLRMEREKLAKGCQGSQGHSGKVNASISALRVNVEAETKPAPQPTPQPSRLPPSDTSISSTPVRLEFIESPSPRPVRISPPSTPQQPIPQVRRNMLKPVCRVVCPVAAPSPAAVRATPSPPRRRAEPAQTVPVPRPKPEAKRQLSASPSPSPSRVRRRPPTSLANVGVISPDRPPWRVVGRASSAGEYSDMGSVVANTSPRRSQSPSGGVISRPKQQPTAAATTRQHGSVAITRAKSLAKIYGAHVPSFL